MGWCEGGRTEKFVDDRDWSAVKRQSMEGGEVVVEVEAQEQSKLGVMQRLLVHGSKDRCMDVKCKLEAEEAVGHAKKRYCCTES